MSFRAVRRLRRTFLGSVFRFSLIAENEAERLAVFEHEFGSHPALIVGVEWGVSSEHETRAVSGESCHSLGNAQLMSLPAIVKRRTADGCETNRSADAQDATMQLMEHRRIRGPGDGHEVLNFGDAVFQRESRDQNIGGGPVELLVAYPLSNRLDPKAPTFGIVENRSKDARRVKVGRAVPIDRAIHAHQCGGAHVANDSVV